METTIINSVGVALGLIAPAALLFVLFKGIDSTGWDSSTKKSYRSKLLLGIYSWIFLMFILTTLGVFEYQEGDVIPRFMIGLLVPVTVMLYLLMKPDFGKILNATPLSAMVGSQFFRILGAVFFLIASTGMGPADFVSSGYGDVFTGTLAIIAAFMLSRNYSGGKLAAWAFTLVGMLDLVNVSRILIANYPIWSDANPSTGFAGSFPMMLVLGITAPAALILHIYGIRALLNPQASSRKIALS